MDPARGDLNARSPNECGPVVADRSKRRRPPGVRRTADESKRIETRGIRRALVLLSQSV